MLNFQLQSPSHVTRAIGDHYVVVDFDGWRYFELIEPEGERHADYQWPYSSIYALYRASLRFDKIETLGLWYNNLPPGKKVACYISPIKAIPLVKARLVNPAITVGGKTITFPVELESGCYIEFKSLADCRLYDPTGKLIRELEPQGEVPTLTAGENQVTFTCDSPQDYNPRAIVTVITSGEPLRE